MRAPSRAAVHTAAVYAAIFGALGAHLPFWPVWLLDWGLSAGEVGLFTSFGVAARVVAGLGFPVLADRLDRRRAVMAALCLIGALVFAVHPLVGGKALLIVATVAAGAMLAGALPLGEALGAGAARKHRFAYAPVRAWGSLSFLVVSLAMGVLVARHGTGIVVWSLVACLVLAAALSLFHPGGGAARDQTPPDLAGIWALIVNPTFALFMLAAGLCVASQAVYFAYGSIHWRALGLSEGTIGALWAFGVAAEVALMLGPARWILHRLGPAGALMLSCAAGVFRWGWMMADPTGAVLWVLQALHAVTFGLGHLAAIGFIVVAVPDRFGASAQGAYAGLAGGILTAVAMVVAAAAYPVAGGLAYGISVALCAGGLVAAFILSRRWNGALLPV